MDESALFAAAVKHMSDYLERQVTHLTLESRLDTAFPGVDSLKVFEMMLYLEDCFGISFEEAQLANMVTMRDLLGGVRQQLTKQSA